MKAIHGGNAKNGDLPTGTRETEYSMAYSHP
jgi:hypothetical protein